MQREEQALSADVALTFRVPAELGRRMCAVLKAHPGVQHSSSGWAVVDLTICGLPDVIAAIKPRLDAVQADYVAGEAW